MSSIEVQAALLPEGALLDKYRDRGDYTDCFLVEIPRVITLEQFVEAFYTTRVFKLERLILKMFLGAGSTDAQAAALARAEVNRFAAWTVEERTPFQLLMCDVYGRTRSWLMAAGRGPVNTRLYFGSAVVGRGKRRDGKPRLGLSFGLLLGFHKRYSRILLAAAVKRAARLAE